MKPKACAQSLTSLLISSALFLAACTDDSIDDLTTGDDCNTANITYSASVKPILESKCYSCHNQANSGILGSGINLEGYEKLKPFATNGKLVGVINHAPGFSPMPKGAAKLSACQIKQIEVWVDAGALNN